MGTIKKTISIDEKIAQEAGALAPNFSAIVEAALIEYIQHHRTQKALQAFGKWEDRKESSADIVNELRRKDERELTTTHDIQLKKINKSKR